MKHIGVIVFAALLSVLVMSCQTTKPVAPAQTSQASAAQAVPAQTSATAGAGTSLIEAEVEGFSPLADNGHTSIDFSLLFAKGESVKSWKVQIAGPAGVQRSFSGTGTKLPSSLSWDGANDSGSPAPEGRYTASLSVDYGDAFTPGTASTKPFVLDRTPPTATIGLNPKLFAPVNPSDTLAISLDAHSALAAIDSWELEIFDPAGNLFKTFSGKGASASLQWDGKGINGDLVVSAADYPISLKLRDEYGNTGVVKDTIHIDLLVLKTPTGFKIPDTRIYFKPFTPDYRDVPPKLQKQNIARLDELAAKLKKFPDYKIRIVGHAVMIHWDNPALGKIEQETVLLPLSKARSDAIKQAMVDRGISADLITTDGVGAADQIVPDSDIAERWQNRRTAVFLDK
ncbi:MAG: OmpA family protein [Treponema sp.]|nr:OmpA family protein [Treponema sp.]